MITSRLNRHAHGLSTLTTIGTLTSLVGFVIQLCAFLLIYFFRSRLIYRLTAWGYEVNSKFHDLLSNKGSLNDETTGMHWSATIAQLMATGIMTALRAFIRRRLTHDPDVKRAVEE